MVGSVLTEKGFLIAFVFGVICLFFSMRLTDEGGMTMLNMTALWVVGIFCVAIGLFAIFANKKGWLK